MVCSTSVICFDEYRPNLFGRIPFAVPFFSVREILSTFEPSEFSRSPSCGANRVFDFIQSKTAFARVSLRVIGQTDRFHTPIKKAVTTNCKDFDGLRSLQIAVDPPSLGFGVASTAAKQPMKRGGISVTSALPKE
jgi:hypothetical protein